MWDLVLWPGIEPQPPALGAWSLSYWTTRKVPIHFLESTMHLHSLAPLLMLLSAWNALPCLMTSLSISPCWKSHRLSPLAVRVNFLVTVLPGWASPRGGSSDERCNNSSSSMLSISRDLLDSLAFARFEHKKGLYTAWVLNMAHLCGGQEVYPEIYMAGRHYLCFQKNCT